MHPDVERTRAIHAESQRLVQFLLPPDAWRRPSCCARWQVADGAVVEAASDAVVDVALHSDTATGILVIFGRAPLRQAMADERLRVEGDKALAIAFAQRVQGG